MDSVDTSFADKIEELTGVGVVPKEENLGRDYPYQMPEAQCSKDEDESPDD